MCLHSKDDQILRGNFGDLIGCRDARNVLATVLLDQFQTVGTDRSEMWSTRYDGDVFAGLRQPRGEQAADTARANNANFHRAQSLKHLWQCSKNFVGA